LSKTVINLRPSTLVLPKTGITLKPGEEVEIDEMTDELKKSVKNGLIREVKGAKTNPVPKVTTDTIQKHDWEVDYQNVEAGTVTVKDVISGKSLTGKIVDTKGDNHYVLENIGTVKEQAYWPTKEAAEHFNGTV